ncbi:hypothetical protein [Streptomyces sp900116325]|uniref:hypothetical protein n=1 Tax=Streptomyces sp. 900116325 TaxID=3154295 RepID=UPI0033244A20
MVGGAVRPSGPWGGGSVIGHRRRALLGDLPRVAQLLAGALTGLVAARTGYSGTFWCGAALCALACVLLRARGRAGERASGEEPAG